MDADKLIEFAPYILVVVMFLFQNRVFVRPEQLEKKHREIIKEIEKDFEGKFVEINAYKEFQNHIYSKLDELNASMNDIKGVIMTRRKDD